MTTIAQDLERIASKVPPLPEVAMRVLHIVEDVDFAMAKLVEVIQTDPSLTARLLKLCNSSLFALQNEITSIPQALSYLGIRHITRAVIASCTSSYFRDGDVTVPYLKSTVIWRHSVACASACQRIAREVGGIDQGTAYTTGILHNIGKVPLGQLWSQGSLEAAEPLGYSALVDCERQQFGTDHSEVAGIVTDKWSVPEELKEAVREHHNAAVIDECGILTAILHVADMLVLRAGVGQSPGRDVEFSYFPSVLERLRTDEQELDAIAVEILAELDNSQSILDLV